jgi:Flp pilus assembly protein TadG
MSSVNNASRRRFRLRRFSRAREGAVAVEFAFLALPFLFMLFSVLELALVFLLSASLDTAMEDAARQIRTGGFQNANGTRTEEEQKVEFRNRVCGGMLWLSTGCQSALHIDVKSWDETDETTWSEANVAPDPYAPATDPATGKVTIRFTTLFNAGGPKDIVWCAATSAGCC